jgi:hypothetical protein
MRSDRTLGGVSTRVLPCAALRLESAAADAALIVAISLLSAALYVGAIGFYSDDWIFLATYRASPDQSYFGLVRFFADANMLPRPVQLLYLTALYRLFGLEPLGYHLVNSTVMAGATAMLYVALRELTAARLFALALALLWALLPHASTNRIWYALFETNVSALFFFLALYADLRRLRAAEGHRWRWEALGAASLLASTLAYELFIPLFALIPAAAWYRGRVSELGRRQVTRTALWLLGRNLALLVAVMLYKAAVTDRNDDALSDPLGQLVWWANLNYQAFATTFGGPYGARLPRVWLRLLTQYRDPAALGLSLAAGALVFAALYRVAERQQVALTNRRAWALLFALGLALISAGYAIFLTNRQAVITTTGMNNRSSGAATLGIAVMLVALFGLISSLPRGARARRLAFCGLTAFYCASGFLLNTTIGGFWAAASREQQVVLAEIKQRFPALEPESRVFLDGMCPYIGPGIIFEAEWDLTGALRIAYGDHTLHADVVNPLLKIRPEGIYTELYFNDIIFHPYEKLWVYNRQHGVVVPLRDAAAAERYFERYNPTLDSGCRRVRPGLGYAVW